jgi:hypothetical protein
MWFPKASSMDLYNSVKMAEVVLKNSSLTAISPKDLLQIGQT